MTGKKRVLLAAALIALAALAAFAEATRPEAVLLDGSAASGPPPFGAVDQGGGKVAAVFINGGSAPGPCLSAAAAAVAARYRTISFSLDQDMVASLGGQEGTAAELARLIGEAGVERACIVGCCSAAALVAEATGGNSAIASAVFFGQPAPGTVIGIPAVYLAPSAGPEELAGQVFELLGATAAPRPAARVPFPWRRGAAIPD